jgi:hypothetical protein
MRNEAAGPARENQKTEIQVRTAAVNSVDVEPSHRSLIYADWVYLRHRPMGTRRSRSRASRISTREDLRASRKGHSPVFGVGLTAPLSIRFLF